MTAANKLMIKVVALGKVSVIPYPRSRLGPLHCQRAAAGTLADPSGLWCACWCAHAVPTAPAAASASPHTGCCRITCYCTLFTPIKIISSDFTNTFLLVIETSQRRFLITLSVFMFWVHTSLLWDCSFFCSVLWGWFLLVQVCKGRRVLWCFPIWHRSVRRWFQCLFTSCQWNLKTDQSCEDKSIDQ